MATIFCDTHPGYQVKRPPTVKCDTCARMWARKHARRVCVLPGCKRVFVWHGDSYVRYHSPACGYIAQQNTPVNRPARDLVKADRLNTAQSSAFASLKKKYVEALKTIESQEKALGVTEALTGGISTYRISPKADLKGQNEATAVLVASDWHIEERVGKEVGGLNRYNLDIAQARATAFFQNGVRLVHILEKDIPIPTIILALLGDFISNDIHDEFPEINELQPIHAIVRAQNMVASGIEFLLKESEANLVIPCHSGNHARTTKTTRFTTEAGHSLEYLMYSHLAAYFWKEPRVQFLIADGIHSYVDVYSTTIRFHHGHAIKYNGGVGGIYIPTLKAIAQWNKARHADLDVFGHFHQQRDGGNFLCNGSLIGHNAFGISIKADFEPPKQTLFLVDKKRGKTGVWPVFVQ